METPKRDIYPYAFLFLHASFLSGRKENPTRHFPNSRPYAGGLVVVVSVDLGGAILRVKKGTV